MNSNSFNTIERLPQENLSGEHGFLPSVEESQEALPTSIEIAEGGVEKRAEGTLHATTFLGKEEETGKESSLDEGEIKPDLGYPYRDSLGEEELKTKTSSASEIALHKRMGLSIQESLNRK